jgi:hypothetical protein
MIEFAGRETGEGAARRPFHQARLDQSAVSKRTQTAGGPRSSWAGVAGDPTE